MGNNNYNELEILKMAMDMEDEGYTFYTNAAKYSEGEVKKFLLNAANQELNHKKLFEKLYDEQKNIINIDDEYIFDPEVSEYFNGMIKDQVFKKKEDKKEEFINLKSAAKMAVEAEKTTILFYTKMYEGVKKDSIKKLLLEILEEEKGHVEYFENLYNKI